LFDTDAEIGVKELGLAFMRSIRPHAGFPESAYNKYANQLIRLGYMVGRVEQTETPQQLEEANKLRAKGQKKRKVVERQMCSVLSKVILFIFTVNGFEGNCLMLPTLSFIFFQMPSGDGC
jgi:DNA mismatch repair protein MSH6